MKWCLACTEQITTAQCRHNVSANWRFKKFDWSLSFAAHGEVGSRLSHKEVVTTIMIQLASSWASADCGHHTHVHQEGALSPFERR